MRATFKPVLLLLGLLLGAAAPAEAQPIGCDDYAQIKGGKVPEACDRAIEAATDPKTKSTLLFRRAYILIDPTDFELYERAGADLDEAIRLDPENIAARHERGYLHIEFGRWREAEMDLDVEIALAPNLPGAYSERAMARFYQANLAGAHEDREAVVRLRKNAGSLLARGITAMWLGRYGEAESDFKDARKAAAAENATGTDKDAAAYLEELVLWRTASPAGASGCKADEQSYERRSLIGDCTLAFFAADTVEEKAKVLTGRAIAWLVAGKNQAAHTTDLRLAVGLQPNDAAYRSNLGFAYASASRSTAAIWEFDVSIREKPEFLNYAGRASAKARLGDLDGAEADARQSLKYRRNQLALMVLGDVTYLRTNAYDKAKDFWLQAYEIGPADDALVERLKLAGVTPPEKAKKP